MHFHSCIGYTESISPYHDPCSREHQRVPWQPVLVCRFGSRKLAGGWLKKLRRVEASDTEIFYISGFLCKSCNPCAPSWPRERSLQCWAELGLVAHSVPLVSLSIAAGQGNCSRAMPGFLPEQTCSFSGSQAGYGHSIPIYSINNWNKFRFHIYFHTSGELKVRQAHHLLGQATLNTNI